jgi:hypothetical protein
MISIERDTDTKPQFILHDLGVLVQTVRSPTCRGTSGNADRVALCITNLAAVFGSIFGKIFSDTLELLVGDFLFLEGQSDLLLAFGAETIVAWRFGGIILRQFLQTFDLVWCSAAPVSVSVRLILMNVCEGS